MILGIVSKNDHAQSHARALEREGYTVVMLGPDGDRIPKNLNGLICRVSSCSHKGSRVARAWAKETRLPFIVEDGLSGIRQRLRELDLVPLQGLDLAPAPRVHSAPEPLPEPRPTPPLVRPPIPPEPPMPSANPVAAFPPLPSTKSERTSPRKTGRPRDPNAMYPREKRLQALVEVFTESPDLDGGEAWRKHEAKTSPRAMDRTLIAEARKAAAGGSRRPARSAPATTPASAPTRLPDWMPSELGEHLLEVMAHCATLKVELRMRGTTISWTRTVVEEGTVSL